jgi:hypothetical protein
MAVQRLVEYRLKRLKSPDARRLLLLMMNALIDGYQGTLLSVESEHRFEWDAHIGNLLTIAYYLGSFCPAPELAGVHRRTFRAISKRKTKNKDWVELFEKAIRQAHSGGLTAQKAVDAALERLDVKIPVEKPALLSRERQLRTGKKRK